MSHSKMLCGWTTLQGNNGRIVIQPEEEWADTGSYQDAAFYFELGGYTSQVTATMSVDVQTSPTKDAAFFTASAGSTAAIARFTVSTSTSLGVQAVALSRWADESNQPLSKYTRYYVTFASGTTSQTTISYRIWMTLNQSGY